MYITTTDDELLEFIEGCVTKLRQRRHYRTRTFEESLFYSAKARSKSLDIDFDLELSDINIPKSCPYLGCKITRIKHKGFHNLTNPSLDRIDPEKGYVKGNIQVISRKANTMKQDASPKQLIKFAESVLRIHRDCT